MGFRYNPDRRLVLFFFLPIRATCCQTVSLAPSECALSIRFLEKIQRLDFGFPNITACPLVAGL
jgi:hypothetical protein